MLGNVALVDPLDYRTDAKYMREVLASKGQGSGDGFLAAMEGMASGLSKAALWAMGAGKCPSCTAEAIENAWNAALQVPEELRMKGYLDNLHIMQGHCAAVVRANEASSTAIGIGVGVSIATGLQGGGPGVISEKIPSLDGVQLPKPRVIYLDNVSAPEIRGRMLGALQDVRRDLPEGGNAAFAEVAIPVLSKDQILLKSFSGYNMRTQDFIPKPEGDLSSWILKPQESTSRYIGGASAYLRDADAEFKILETLAQRLGSNYSAVGRINLASEKAVCPSCTGVVLQFRERYPNIQLNVFTRD
nr:deaminase domain-containing protein [Pseudomonas mosselii]